VSKLAEEQEVERLFGLGPESFVAARNEAARRLRREGDAGAAARVTALRRPSMSAWAVNQLARGRGPELEGLLEVGGRLRAAHRAAVAGGGADALRAATRAEREAVAGLLAAAVEVLESTGHATTEATRDRIAATLHAAAADPAAAELVRRGRLTHDLDPAGFGTPDAAPEGSGEPRGGAPVDRPEPGVTAGKRRAARATSKGRDVAASRRGDGKAAVDEEAVAASRARRLATVAARDAARRRARLAADQAVLATRHAERLGRLADQAERESARARTAASAAIDAAAAARERASRAAKELTEAEGRLADDG